jgi:indoleamine 2,3-dioxygenase
MLQYMPLAHRTFLLHLSTHPTPLRPLVEHYARTHPKLAEAYDGALEALRRFREKHMRIVSLYIIQQARRRPSERIRRILGHSEADDDEAEEVKIELGEMRGTGGSPLFKFLKRCRDNTTRAMIGKPAGPGFDLS